jgi:hypothetical protein
MVGTPPPPRSARRGNNRGKRLKPVELAKNQDMKDIAAQLEKDLNFEGSCHVGKIDQSTTTYTPQKDIQSTLTGRRSNVNSKTSHR